MRENRYSVMAARFPYMQIEHPAGTDWLMKFNSDCINDDRVGTVIHKWWSGTPITMMRNRAVRTALEMDIDILLMLDNDNIPDNDFWTRAIDLIDYRYRHFPTIVGAPYCGPPPDENVYIFRWESKTSGDPEGETAYKLIQYSRAEASVKEGYEAVAALPTGCIAIDMRIFKGFNHINPLPKPWFYYEWEDDYCSEKKSTEDVTFTRNVAALYLAGMKENVCYVDWDSWALHVKHKKVDRPATTVPYNIMQMFERYTKEAKPEVTDAGN